MSAFELPPRDGMADAEFIAAKSWKSEAVEHILHLVETDYV